MRSITTILLFLSFYGSAFGQKLKITDMNRDYFQFNDVSGFDYLHEDASNVGVNWIANFTIEFDTIRPGTLKSYYNKMSLKANKLGANAFRVIDSDIYTSGSNKFIQIEVFHLNMENRNDNAKLFAGPRIYLFGFNAHHQSIQGYHIEVNGKKILLQELRYQYYQPKVGDVIKITLGRFFKKDVVKLEITDNMMPRYFRFTIYKGIFKRGLINEHEWSFGEFLARILNKKTAQLSCLVE